MIVLRWFVAVALSASPLVSATPADAARARAVTAEVNGSLGRMQVSSFRAQRPDVEYVSEVRAWRDATGVRKVEVTDLDDSGSVVGEYYYGDGELVFAYVAVKGWRDGREVTRNEQRLYFRDGALVRWLDGMDKVLRAADDPAYADESRLRVDAARFYRDAAIATFQKPGDP
jgi:hypothetical protein